MTDLHQRRDRAALGNHLHHEGVWTRKGATREETAGKLLYHAKLDGERVKVGDHYLAHTARLAGGMRGSRFRPVKGLKH